MVETDDLYLKTLLNNPNLLKLLSEQSKELACALDVEEMCGPDSKLDEFLENAERGCDDLG